MVFVERSPRSLVAIRQNLSRLALVERARVVRGDVPAVLRRMARGAERFDVALLDPPYEGGDLLRALTALVEAGVLADRAAVVVESAKRHPLPPVAGLVVEDERIYGETVVTRLCPDAERSGGGADEAPVALAGDEQHGN